MADHEESTDRFSRMNENYEGYDLYDLDDERIGSVDDLFVDADDQVEYIGVKMGFSGAKSTLIPSEIARFDEGQGEGQRRIRVSERKSRLRDGPVFGEDGEITADFERQVRSYYGLEDSQSSGDESHTAIEAEPGTEADESGESREHGQDREVVNVETGSDLEDEDELRVQRSEEELRAGVREREAGRVSVRKSVKTERERIAVPKRREEVSVERVAVDRDAQPGEIGEDEASMPVVEEEVVVDKQAVVKEEIRVRKDVVQEEEVVEEEVRKEEIDIDDTSGTTGQRS